MSGLVLDEGATDVALKVTDASRKAVDSMKVSQDVTKKVITTDASGGLGRYFQIPMKFPDTLVDQTVTLSLSFKVGGVSWTSSQKVQIVKSSALVAELPVRITSTETVI